MLIPCSTTPSTNRRVFCTSPVTRLKIELEPCTSKKRKLSRCSLAYTPVAQVRDDLALRQPGGGHVVVVGQHRPQQRLRDDRQRQHRDDLQRRPARRGRPAKRIDRRPLRRVQRVADDVNDHPSNCSPPGRAAAAPGSAPATAGNRRGTATPAPAAAARVRPSNSAARRLSLAGLETSSVSHDAFDPAFNPEGMRKGEDSWWVAWLALACGGANRATDSRGCAFLPVNFRNSPDRFSLRERS